MAPSDLLKPPTALAGYTDYSTWGFALTDALEHVPTLMFPASVPVYAEMRRDPQLAAVLAGITLPIRRATWQVDPTGCRPEVARLVADDLGLPVAGNDTPSAARVYGVSWQEHLRQALLHLTFGFYGFEMLADTSSGQARLVGLYERVPATVAYIHSTRSGDFGGISQLLRPDDNGAPEITPDRLVWYCHDREGAAWHGTSIMRPGYASWLVKQSLRRVLAISNERFGTGVPTVEWDPGVIPTQEQMAAAQRAASAARVGETAGLAMPPGARLVLKGLVGGAPNTLDALRWLDQQISGMVLSRWMDLGSSQTGSRALGESFIDTFLLAIASLAEDIASVATRQIAARIVAWNWGLSEPVPQVTVSDVGTRHEVTADALNALLQSGALQADPQLEEWVRRTYRLPPRDPNVPWAPPPRKGAGGAGGGDGSVTDAMALAAAAGKPAARPRRKRGTAGQLALPIAAADGEPARAPSADEQASGVDFEQVQADHDKAVAGLVAVAGPLLAAVAASLVAAVAAELAAGALSGALEPAEHTVEALATAIDAAAVKLAGKSAKRAAGEVKSAGLPVTGVAVDDGPLAEQAQATARLVATGMAQTASRVALLHYGPGVKPGVVSDAVQTALDALVENDKSWVTGSLSSALWAAQHAGRTAAFEALLEAHGDDAAVWVASEVADSSSCLACKEANGKRFSSYAEALAMYPTGRNVACAGADRCRGTLFAVPAGART